jgi:hypothetical protein
MSPVWLRLILLHSEVTAQAVTTSAVGQSGGDQHLLGERIPCTTCV